MALMLVVEDDPDVSQLIVLLLQQAGHRTVTAANGAEGIALAQQHLPDLIIMDLKLPVIDGWTATWQLKSQARTRHIPVLALTAHALTDDKRRARAAGCDGFITKPFDIAALLAQVEAFTNRSRLVGDERT